MRLPTGLQAVQKRVLVLIKSSYVLVTWPCEIGTLKKGVRQRTQHYNNSEKSVKDTMYDCQRTVVCPQYNTS
jgi:hypothetical protein